LYSDALLESGWEESRALGRQGVRDLVGGAIAARGASVTLTDILDPFLNRVTRPLSDDLTALMCLRHPHSA
jgi:hypothetical protein